MTRTYFPSQNLPVAGGRKGTPLRVGDVDQERVRIYKRSCMTAADATEADRFCVSSASAEFEWEELRIYLPLVVK